MARFNSGDRWLGLVCIVLAVAVAAVWIRFDIDSGLVEKARRQVRIGDALMPTLGAVFVALGGALTWLGARPGAATLSRGNLRFLAMTLLCLVVAFALMRWLGPLAVWVSGEDAGYRALRDTAPWKHLGFVAGAVVLVAGLIAQVEGRPSLRGVLIGAVAALILIAVYDWPFDDLLLPPNGDV